jgi:hypothetical protein
MGLEKFATIIPKHLKKILKHLKTSRNVSKRHWKKAVRQEWLVGFWNGKFFSLCFRLLF